MLNEPVYSNTALNRQTRQVKEEMHFEITIQCRLMKLWWKLSPTIIEPKLTSITLNLIPSFLKPTRTRRPKSIQKLWTLHSSKTHIQIQINKQTKFIQSFMQSYTNQPIHPSYKTYFWNQNPTQFQHSYPNSNKWTNQIHSILIQVNQYMQINIKAQFRNQNLTPFQNSYSHSYKQSNKNLFNQYTHIKHNPEIETLNYSKFIFKQITKTIHSFIHSI